MGKYFRKYSMRNIYVDDYITNKNKKIHSCFELDQLKKQKEIKIRQNFKNMIRRLMANTNVNRQKCIITFLNVMASCEDIISTKLMAGIPSIQNMLSHHLINPIQQDSIVQQSSRCSITQPIQSSLLMSQPQIPIYFMCLLQKIKKLISCPLNKKQNEYIIKGTWNILLKYWKDNNFTIFALNENIQWGLLELLNFNFSAGKKQRFMAEQLLRNTLKHIQCSINSFIPEQRSQNSISCNQQSIDQVANETLVKNDYIIQNKSYQNLQQIQQNLKQMKKLKQNRIQNVCSVKYLVQIVQDE